MKFYNKNTQGFFGLVAFGVLGCQQYKLHIEGILLFSLSDFPVYYRRMYGIYYQCANEIF